VTVTETLSAIRSRFATQIEDGQGLATIYDNDPDGPPTDGTKWCRLTVLGGGANRVTIGVPEYRKDGVAIAQLFAPAASGDGELAELADAIATAFEDVVADGVTYGVVRWRRVGLFGGQYQINVVVPWRVNDQG
jgi:hypothetical protein